MADKSTKAAAVLGFGVVALLFTGWLDFLTGGDLAFQLVHLLAVCTVAWHTSLTGALVTAELSGVI